MALCDEILESCRSWVDNRLQVTSLGTSCLLRMPFFDSSGDPIAIVVGYSPDGFLVHDGGIIAGHLFSLGQHTENTLAFKLLDSLCKAYNMTIDRNQGLVKAECSLDSLAATIFELTKLVITITTATAHVSVRPHRFRTLGARVRSKVRDHYARRNILDWVEPYYEIQGETVDIWPIDFHWKIRQGDLFKDVFVSTIDLNVAEPLRKVEHITALAIDAQGAIKGNDFRVVLDKHGQNSMADVAASYLQQHGDYLGYKLYDFGDDNDRDRFIDQSEREVLGAAGDEWRTFWAAAKAGAIDPQGFVGGNISVMFPVTSRPLILPPANESGGK